MEDTEKILPNGSDMEVVEAGGQEVLHENSSQGAQLNDENTTAPDLPADDELNKGNGSADVVEQTEVKTAADGAIEESESKGNACGNLLQNQLVAGSPSSPEKFSTPKLESDIVGQLKNGCDDVEMAEAEEDPELLEDGTPAQQAAFMKELENFHKEKALDFKPPKFYGELLNCLKLWRAVIRLGGYDVVTTSKLWRQVGESFHPPKTCTTVSWTFRIFYEKALLEYEKHKKQIGELQLPVGPFPQSTSVEKETTTYQAQGSGRARRDAAARAMQGWHAQRLLGYGEVTEPIVKDKNTNSSSKREKNLKSIGSLKHKTTTHPEQSDKQVVTSVVDVGPRADWVKINVRETKDCFEVYALVPGLLREEVRVQSDPAGRLVITGQPEQVDNPWGITPFQKVVSLPARIDPLHTSAVVSLHGRLFVRVPFEQGSV